MHDKKNLLKLLPAAAVIAAVAVTAVQGKATDGIQKEPENTEVRDAGELSGLLKTAYFDEDTSTDSGTKEIAKAKKKKAKKSGIKKGTAKALPDESKKTSAEGQGSTTTPTTEVPESGYKDGTYQGSGTGFGGTITVQVTVSGGKITAMSFIPKTLQKRAAVPKKPCGKKENLLVHGNLMDTGNQNRTDTSW